MYKTTKEKARSLRKGHARNGGDKVDQHPVEADDEALAGAWDAIAQYKEESAKKKLLNRILVFI